MEVGWDKRMLGATYGWETRLFRTFGGINPATLPSGGDRLLVFRACLLGGVVHEHRPLIKWRQHQDQQTKHICDRLNGPLIEAETLQAHATTCVLAMLKDVLDLKKKRVEGLGPIHNQLVGRLVQDTNQWIMLRNHLHNEGKRPTWADRSEMESRPVADTFQPEAV